MKKTIILRTEIEQTLPTKTVSNLLRKAGFDIGHSTTNGRIRGLGGFLGDVEVAFNFIDSETKFEVKETLNTRKTKEFRNVKVVVENPKKVNINDIAKVLIDNGLIVSELREFSLVVDNK